MAREEEGVLRVEQLLERSDWIRALALSLARDPHDAEDLAQSTIALALEKHPAAGVPPRRWLAAVMRNLFRQDLRAERRRARREESAARPESVPSESTLLERLEVQRRVVDAVRALDDPYRSAVLLRYFEGLSPMEIASRTDLPIRTVHSRLHRGLQLLRQKLDAELGDRCAWLGLLLPLAPGKAGAVGAAGGILVSSKGVIAGCAACVLLVAAWSWFAAGDRRAPAPASSGTSSTAAATPDSSIPIGRSDPDAREAIPAPTAETKPTQSEETWRVHGRVLDVRGAPVAGVHLRAQEQAHAKATSDPFGEFEIEIRPGSVKLVAVDDAWVTLRFGQIHAWNRDREHFLVVAPFVALAGRVVDGSERPLENASVEVQFTHESFASFPLPLDSTGLEVFATRTDADGTFRIARAPVVPYSSLLSRFGSLRADARPIPDHSVADLTIRLEEPPPLDSALEGVVVHEDGKPAPGARVHLAGVDVTADAEGGFRLPLRRVDASTPLVATLAGFQPAIVPGYGAVLESTDLHPTSIRLVLGPPPLSITGRVLGRDGAPQSSWTVALLDPLVLTPYRVPAVTAEKLTANGDPNSLTRADGRFRIEGLRNVAYRLEAWSREGAMMHTDPIQAGSEDVVLQAPEDPFVERVTGRVTARDGTAIAKAEIQVSLTTERAGFASASLGVQTTKTQLDGTFELRNVPKRFAGLSVGGEGLDLTSVDLEKIDLSRPIEIVVVRMCAFRFEDDGGKDPAMELGVLGPEGTKLYLVIHEAGQMSSMYEAGVADGRSQVYWVREDASRLVLRGLAGFEASQPLRLVPGEINVVRRQR
jgi:RNA polymerase sigma-70 factor (ECF subfamily)